MCAVVNAFQQERVTGEGGKGGCRSRVDTRIYPGCRWCSLHLILVGEIDDIILHNSGLPRRLEAYSLAWRKQGSRRVEVEEGERRSALRDLHITVLY